ncbi:MAG TPA: hypothetical protein DC053_14695 [Lachnoclostridium sp.]|nr:hypothetical protein [Lachnoclostridium sp.]
MALGALGTVVPGLPATPFLLLALLCFTKGSEKINCWFRGTNLYACFLSLPLFCITMFLFLLLKRVRKVERKHLQRDRVVTI